MPSQVRSETELLSDEELARAAQAGSLAEFEQLVHRYEGRILRFVANSFRNSADAQEVTQETFVSAYLHLDRFDARRSFATWLFTIARRKSIDRHRAARPFSGQEAPELPNPDDPAVLMIQREDADELWARARQVLPDLQFQALWLRYAEDLSVEHIARVLHRTPVHVKVLLFRARTRLARELKPGTARDNEVKPVGRLRPALAAGDKAGK
jgi:RNA polymerase sigma-70 factor (ECF subfamily)